MNSIENVAIVSILIPQEGFSTPYGFYIAGCKSTAGECWRKYGYQMFSIW